MSNFKVSTGQKTLHSALALAFIAAVALWAGSQMQLAIDDSVKEIDQLAATAALQ